MIMLAIGLGIGLVLGWEGKTLYLRRLHKMGLYIRKVQRGSK